MSDETIHIPSAGRGLPSRLRRLFGRVLAPGPRRPHLHAGDLNDRRLADLGLRRDDYWRTDPRPPSFFGPNGR